MRSMGALLIGDVAERAGVPAPTIRYYESIGLLKPAPRASSGYRRYSEHTIEELRFIKKAQALGFSLDEVAEILQLSRAGRKPCAQVLSLGHEHLAAVDERIRQLQAFRNQLASELAKWDQQQAGVTCDGLCQFIADAEPSVSHVRVTDKLGSRPRSPERKSRQPRGSRVPRGI
jgi:DNA-binding transcriptional MerR regulator